MGIAVNLLAWPIMAFGIALTSYPEVNIVKNGPPRFSAAAVIAIVLAAFLGAIVTR